MLAVFRQFLPFQFPSYASYVYAVNWNVPFHPYQSKGMSPGCSNTPVGMTSFCLSLKSRHPCDVNVL